MPDNYVQDPYNTQNFNRYGYVLNNPLKYTDASGESFFSVLGNTIYGLFKIGAVTAAAAYSISSLFTGNWNWKGFGMSALGGAIAGAITVVSFGFVPPVMTLGSIVSSIVMGVVAGLLPSVDFNVGNWNFSVSPSVAFGNGFGAGASFSASFSDGHFSFSGGVGVTYYGNYSGLGISGTEFRKSLQASWDDGGKGLTLGTNFWSGSGGLKDLSQRTGLLGLHSGDFRATYENDGSPFSGTLGDGQDRRRTAAMNLSIGEFSAGFNIFTGDRILEGEKEVKPERGFFGRLFHKVPNGADGGFGANLPYGAAKEKGTRYRMGLGYIGFGGYRGGIDSYRYVGHPIQNIGAHYYASPQVGFPSLSNSIRSYFEYKTPNRFTKW